MDADFDMFQGMIDASRNDRNKNMQARFYDRVLKTGETDANGLPVFENVCFVEIRVKDSYDVYDQPATAEKKKRFAPEYNRYLQEKKQVENGAPLEQFAFLTAAEIESLKYRGIFTVEALAALDEEKARGLNVEKEQALARRFLEKARGNASLSLWQKKEDEFKRQISRKDEQILSLQKEVKNLRQKLDAYHRK